MQTYITDINSVCLGEFKGGGFRWHMNDELVFIPHFPIFPLAERKKSINYFMLHTHFVHIFIQNTVHFKIPPENKKLQRDVTHITDVVSVLLGQDNSREVNNTGKLDSTWVLAIKPLIDDSLGMLNFDDIYAVLR